MTTELSWEQQVLVFNSKAAAYHYINLALDNIPTFSMFTKEARRAMAQAIANELPVKERFEK